MRTAVEDIETTVYITHLLLILGGGGSILELFRDKVS